MKILLLLLIVALAANINTVAAEIRLADKPEVASNLRLLEAWIESKLAYDSQPAMNIGIVYDQELIWAKSYGFADLEKKRTAALDDIYMIASQTKMFTALAILKLRDEGRLRLDDPVRTHIPAFRIKNRFSGAPEITVGQLLSHTSGLPSEAAFPYWMDFNFPEMEQILERLPEQETVYPSETKWKYSNLAYALAGEIVAVVSGMPFEEYIRRNFFGPLGMTSSSVSISPELRERLARGYGRRMPDGTRQPRPFTDARGMTACGGFSSTVEDMARFASWVFRLRESGGTEILKSSTIREMQRVHWLMPDWSGGWGLGFAITRAGQRTIVGHGGWVAGYRTNLSMSLDEKVAVITMQNTDDATTLVVDRVFDLVVPAINRAVAGEKVSSGPDPRWEKYVGLYRNAFGDAQVLIHLDKLVKINPTVADPAGSMSTLVPAGEHSFRVEGSGWGSHGELVTFELGPDGGVTRMKEGENYLNRVK